MGPVFTGDSTGRRKVWRRSPDNEDLREALLELLVGLSDLDRDEYSIGLRLGEVVLQQLVEFKERRAIPELRRLADLDEGEPDHYGTTLRPLIEQAKATLTKLGEMTGRKGDANASTRASSEDGKPSRPAPGGYAWGEAESLFLPTLIGTILVGFFCGGPMYVCQKTGHSHWAKVFGVPLLCGLLISTASMAMMKGAWWRGTVGYMSLIISGFVSILLLERILGLDL